MESAEETPSYLPDNETKPNRLLDWLDGSHGKAALALAATLATSASFFANARLGLISALGPVAFAVLVVLTWRRGKKLLTVGAVFVLLVSLVFAVRFYTAPKIVSFYYNGALMDNSTMPYSDLSGIPLTADPAKGHVFYEVLPTEPSDFEVACTRQGRFDDGKQSGDLEWAYIASGKYQTLWVPMPFVRGHVIGKARTLLPCSNWRWQLQSPGR